MRRVNETVNLATNDRVRSLSIAGLLLLVAMALAGDLWSGAVRPGRKRAADEEVSGAAAKPQLIDGDSNPTLRYPIASFSGWSVFSASFGWLDVNRERLRYTVAQPPSKLDEGFESRLDAISEMKFQYGYLRFRTGGKQRTIFYLPPERWGSIHSGPGALKASGDGMMSTMSIRQAITDFDSVLASVKPKPEPTQAAAPAPPPPAAPPAIVLMEPSVSTSGQILEVGNPTITIRGVAMDPTGLPLVTVNGTPAKMQPKSAQAVEFWFDPVPLNVGDTTFEIAASNSAHAQARISFIARYTLPPAPAPKPKPRIPKSAHPIPLAKGEILQMLKSMSSEQVSALVEDNGINFVPTADDVKEIREAGGSDNLVELIKLAAVPPQS